MTSVNEQVRQAERLVRTAADRWDAADLSNIGSCISVLESSVGSLTAASKMLKEGSPEDTRNLLRTMLAGVRKDANRLQRLVDASAAFLRGVPGTPHAEIAFYRPGGSTQSIDAESGAPGLQG